MMCRVLDHLEQYVSSVPTHNTQSTIVLRTAQEVGQATLDPRLNVLLYSSYRNLHQRVFYILCPPTSYENKGELFYLHIALQHCSRQADAPQQKILSQQLQSQRR